MNLIYKSITIILITLLISGCATNKLLKYIDEGPGTYEVTTDKKIRLGNFISGFVTSENIIKLCFNKSSDEIENEYEFTVEISINYLYKKMDELVLEYTKYKAVKPIRIVVSGRNTYKGCDQHIKGQKIIYSGSFRPLSSDSWVHLSRNHKNESLLFSPANSNFKKYVYYSPYVTDLHNNVLFIPLTNEMHQIITLIPGYEGEIPNKVTSNSCKVCYIGLPFTIVFDVVTIPFQGIYHILNIQK